MKLKYLYIFLFLHAAIAVHGQAVKIHVPVDTASKDTSEAIIAGMGADEDTNFCVMLQQIMKDAALNFERIRGKFADATDSGARWTATGGLPGAITSDLVNLRAWVYEGVMYAGTARDEMAAAYEKYKAMIANCLKPDGYQTTLVDAAGVKNYPGLTFVKPRESSPRVILKIEYLELTNTYTLTVGIWNK